MASSVNEKVVIGKAARVEQAEVSDGLRLARYCALEELPGLIFGVVTVVYIVMSLAQLAL
jgi:hypothetical protein